MILCLKNLFKMVFAIAINGLENTIKKYHKHGKLHNTNA